MNNYSLDSCEKLIGKYVNEFKGEMVILEEGCLGLGTILLHGAKGKKTVIIKEVYVNNWSSTHTIRKYNSMPKKYLELLGKADI